MFDHDKQTEKVDLDSVFLKIIASHQKNHTSQIDNIVQYLQLKKINQKKIERLKALLIQFERIFWCIDDTIDAQHPSSTMIISNEIVKFVSFLESFEQVLSHQLERFWDFFRLLSGRKLLSQRILRAINDNLQDLVNIPFTEKMIERQIFHASDFDQIKKLVITNQLNRTQHLKIYLSITEVFFGIKIDFSPFQQYRAIQLVFEDIKDRHIDLQKKNSNCVNLLETRGLSTEMLTTALNEVVRHFLAEIENSKDASSRFLLLKAKKDYENLNISLSLQN
ncbi:MAG: hypothetical protein ACTSUK_07280 [Promethearchaeota archaeon]